ncbi:N-6 DNA methylase [Veillonella sp.]|uniref:N-6 DNA methylase n=1 Tax=Veillonella sp. TaxID=1926307 RepID=UPI0039A11B79
MISNFAANAGKKAGEFYTPHEVSLLMSEVVANHLRGRENIKIYEQRCLGLIQYWGRCA